MFIFEGYSWMITRKKTFIRSGEWQIEQKRFNFDLRGQRLFFEKMCNLIKNIDKKFDEDI